MVQETIELTRKQLTAQLVAAVKQIEQRDGRLDPNEVVREAENPDSPLHPYFEWDDDKAAAGYRLEQARTLIRRIHFEVIIDEKPTRVVQYVSDPTQDAAMYMTLPKIRRQGDIRGVMAEELVRLLGNLDRTIGIARVKAAGLPAGLPDELQRVRGELAALLADCRG